MNIDDPDGDTLISTKRFKTSDDNEDHHLIVKEVVMSSLDNILGKSECENLNLINNEEENSCQTNDSFYGSSTSNNTPNNGNHPMISVNGTNSDSNNSSNINDISGDDIVSLQNEANSSEFKVPLDVNQQKLQLKLKQQLRPSNEYVILLIGLLRRSGQYEHYKQIIENLGGRVVQQPADCLNATHLVIGSEWNQIVNSNFIIDSILKQNIDYTPFRLIPEQSNDGLSSKTTNMCGTSTTVNSNAKDSNNNIHLNQNHHHHLVSTTTAPLPK
ncbi:hypothetical protein BLA29_004549 [Euroglyphus maynei]|uniref:BRCT domain-containing protein n=1 Tax=Euroglyphus maynei TaxID=6958 RepID=A0A1Y3AL38_EURMA|nr:hypothetical protein BLA29_004549 [Euroglyphus maynei]